MEREHRREKPSDAWVRRSIDILLETPAHTHATCSAVVNDAEKSDEDQFVNIRKQDDDHCETDQKPSNTRLFKPEIIQKDGHGKTLGRHQWRQQRSQSNEAGEEIAEEFTEHVFHCCVGWIERHRHREMNQMCGEESQADLIEHTDTEQIVTNTSTQALLLTKGEETEEIIRYGQKKEQQRDDDEK